MASTIFRVDDGVLSAFPGVNIGVLIGRGVAVGEPGPDLEGFKSAVIEEAVESFASGSVTSHPYVSSWRAMYRGFRGKPGDYRPSAEALIRRVVRGRGIPGINTAVDTYNAVSVRHRIPMGGFDLGHVEGAIALRFSEGGETFTAIGSSDPEETYQGEVVYADGARILTRRWNHRDCDETKITEETSSFIMFVDGSTEIPLEAVEGALGDLESQLARFCGGEYTSHVANTVKSDVTL